MEKHDILHEFPNMKEEIHELKVNDHHFRKIFDEYHEVDHEIHSIETGAQVSSDDYLIKLRIKRLHLKDEIYAILKKQ